MTQPRGDDESPPNGGSLGEAEKVRFEMGRLTPRDRYKLLSAVVVPRPIAWITTLGADDTINAAPFSYFNLMGSDPPVVVIGIGDRDGRAKDTARNIGTGGEFVINIVDEATAPAMNVSAGEYAYGVDELAKAGLTPAPSASVRPPRIAESPIHLECRELTTLTLGNTRIVVGEVIELCIRADLVDPAAVRVHAERIGAVGRMHGRGWYTRTRDLFEMLRPRIGGTRSEGEG
jgi:flavin reductase (DIM6/NTAB) family NADH-FMN oxidoreductase RutF